LDINPIASQLLGWPAKKVIGQYCSDIWPDNSGSGHRELGRFLEQAMAMGDRVSFSPGVTITLENGRTTLIEGATYPVLKQGRAIGAMAIFRQVSSDRDVERLQADFVAMASHNLRTPLMSIQASLDYILEANGEIDKNKQMLAEARSQSQKIATFLRELLDVSQLALGKEAPLNIKPVNFLPLLKGIITDFGYASPDVDCELEVPKVLPLVSADEAKVEIILRNLIVHAERRSQTGDAIKIIVEEKEEEIVISILDNGLPIPQQQYQQIFWQVYPMEVNKVNGAMPYGYGIGLFTTRRLVELLGGTIWVSQPGSHGASINFTLPIWR
jgi:signal transduction histidine kinase